MPKAKALIVGVSNYTINGAPDLPFCRNDIEIMHDAFFHGLNVLSEDITMCGRSGDVLLTDFKQALRYFSDVNPQPPVPTHSTTFLR